LLRTNGGLWKQRTGRRDSEAGKRPAAARSAKREEVAKSSVSLQQIFDVVDHFLATVGSDFDDSGVHANGVFRAGLYTESAKDTHTKIDIEAGGKFFDVRIGVLTRYDVNASRRAGCFAHHASDAAR